MNALLRLIAILLLAPNATVAVAGQSELDERLADRMIVQTVDAAARDAFIAAFEADHPEIDLAPLDAVPGRPVYLLDVTLPPGTTSAAIDALELELETGYAAFLTSGEFLYANRAPEGRFGGQSGSTWVDGLAAAQYGTQYARGLLGLDAAQARSRGLGQVVAVLDTGVDAAHPALAARIAPGGHDFVAGVPGAADVGDGADTDGDGDVDELVGHGTFVAGLVTLVAPDARVLPVRVLDGDGVGDGWILTRGIYHAIDQGVEVINVSISSTYRTASVEIAIDAAEAVGIAVVSAAGNLDQSEPEEFPAMRDGIGVAALDDNDVKAGFSNFSERLLLSAPGDTNDGVVDPARAIVSTTVGGGYGAWEGTSFAAPLVAGTVALLRGQHPEWPANEATAELIEDLLALTAVDVYAVNPEHAANAELGAGRLHAGAATQLGPVVSGLLGDLDNSGAIGFADLSSLLDDWGQVHSPADLDGDGNVGFSDLSMLLGAWG